MIQLNDLTKRYGAQVILDGFTHSFSSRGITCLLGPSGSGKSTLLNLLAGFDRDYQGRILVDGQDLARLSPEELCDYRRKSVGFVFQEYHLLPGYTVLENILLAAELNCDDPVGNRGWALAVLRRLNMEEKADEKIENLSGGQKQRVAIARALAGKPKLILADEPTGALDRANADEIMALLGEIAQQRPVLIITHDPKICDWADEVITIDQGKCRVIRGRQSEKAAVRLPDCARGSAAVSPLRRARKNFRIQLPRYLGIALALTAAVAAVLLSCSSQRIVQEQIARFEEANTAFSWGQIPLEEADDAADLLQQLEDAPGIRNSYAQYALPQCRLDFDAKQVSVPGKRFGSIATESVNLGRMPGKGEIALTPSLARQFAQDIRTLIGRELTFSCGNFVRNLRISGVYSGSFDDYYLDADTEQQLYRTLRDKGDPVSVSYQAADFASVVTAADWLEARGYAPVTASGQVQSLQETFARLQGGFVLVSVFIAAVSLAICGLLLVKMTRLRGREMGLFLALGYRRRQMRQMLLWESLLLSGLCAMTAAGAMLVLSALSPVLPIRIAPGQWAAGICAAAVLVCAMTALSNEKLLHTDPASVLRQ